MIARFSFCSSVFLIPVITEVPSGQSWIVSRVLLFAAVMLVVAQEFGKRVARVLLHFQGFGPRVRWEFERFD